MSYPIQPVERPTVSPASSSRTEGPREETKRADGSGQKPDADADSVVAAIQSLGETVELGNQVAEFSYDSDLNRVVIKIFSSANGPREVVRQIPPEEYLEFAARYRELLGVLFDEKL